MMALSSRAHAAGVSRWASLDRASDKIQAVLIRAGASAADVKAALDALNAHDKRAFDAGSVIALDAAKNQRAA